MIKSVSTKPKLGENDNFSWLNGGFRGGSGGGALTFDIEETHTQRTIHYSQSVKDYYKRIDIYRADRDAFDKVAQSGGGGIGLNTANNWLNGAGYGEAGIGAVQIGMLGYRQSLSISSKIGTFGSFSSTYRALGTTSKVLGGAGYLGAGLNTYIDYKSMRSGEIGAGRFGYRTAGTLGSIGGSIGIGAVYGGPWGAVGGAVIGGASWAGEQMYDGYMYWQTQMSIYLTNFENRLKSGWTPGR